MGAEFPSQAAPFPSCNTRALRDLQKWDVSDFQYQDCLEKLPVGRYKGNSHSGVLQSHIFAAKWTSGDTFFPWYFLDAKAINFQMLSVAVPAKASLVFPVSALTLVGTSVYTTVTDQRSHQIWVKTKLAKGRKTKKFHRNLDQSLNPVLHVVRVK